MKGGFDRKPEYFDHASTQTFRIVRVFPRQEDNRGIAIFTAGKKRK